MTKGKDKAPGMGQELAAPAAESVLDQIHLLGQRGSELLASVQEAAGQAAKNIQVLVEQEAELARDLIGVLAGSSELAPEPGDKRFQDATWKDNAVYRAFMRGYLAWSKALGGLVDRSVLAQASKDRARFVVGLLTDALSPSNTLLGNPVALKKLIATRGKSAVQGVQNLVQDIFTNGGMPTQVDKKAFQVGKNLAVSPGAVVFRNEVLELIQYQPTTSEVFARPQLMVPPQINKYYALDLAPGRSMVEFLVKNGFQTFVASWRNPTAAHRDWGFDTYTAALLEAMAAVRDITDSDEINLQGTCSGGMTMSALLGHLAAKGERSVHAASLFVALLDISAAESQLAIFNTPEIIAAAKRYSAARGVLEGQDMGRVFAWMRPNDLVWNYWVNNYLMGNPPPVFDVLYWNNDSTRLSANFHAQLLDILVERLFKKPGGLTILGTPIDLGQVDCDKFVVAGITDHITPWKAVYDAARSFGGKNEFVLSSAGHIQCLINPPGNRKAKYFVNQQLPETADEWLAGAKPAADTWWEHWRAWLAARSGAMRPAPTSLGNERYRPGEKAPGTYVLEA
jgi:polyhydroxyalkanoate synthase subunit PhaC